MRLEIRSAWGDSRCIDTRDLSMLARWIVQTLADLQPTPQAPATVMAWPQWAPSEDAQGRADWIADSRVLGQMVKVLTPRDVVDVLRGQIEEQEKLAAADAIRNRG